MKIAEIIYFFLSVFVLFGCAQKLPTYQKGYGLVAVPYKFNNQTQYPFLYTYEWKSSEDDRFFLKISQKGYANDVSLSGLIPAGQYKIDTIVTRIVKESNIGSTHNKWEQKLDQPFTVYVEEGYVMLIPYVYEIVQYPQGDSILFKYNVHEIDVEEETFYTNKLTNKEGISGWKTKTHY